MATLQAHGTELCRYFSVKRRCLVAVMSDGVSLQKGVNDTWKVAFRKKPDVSLADWRTTKLAKIAELPEWQRRVKSLPTLSTLQKWENDGYCMTPTGHKVEPDGVGPDGVPSWLRIFGLV